MRAIRTWSRIVALVTIVPFAGGCALVNGSHQSVAIGSNVPAEITDRGQYLGNTKGPGMLNVELSRKRAHTLQAEAEGYEIERVRVTRSMNGLGILDTVGAFIFILPIISVFTGGAFSLEPDPVQFRLDEAEDRQRAAAAGR